MCLARDLRHHTHTECLQKRILIEKNIKPNNDVRLGGLKNENNYNL